MFVRIDNAPAAPAVQDSPKGDAVHLMLVETPSLTARGRRWAERAQVGAFNGVELERLIRFEKLSLG